MNEKKNKEPITEAEPPNPHLDRAVELLDNLCDNVSGMIDARLLHAKAKYLQSNFKESEILITKLLENDSNNSNAQMLKSKIALALGSYREAQNCLDNAVGFDFNMQNNIEFSYIKSQILESQTNFEQAILVLNKIIDNYSEKPEKNDNENELIMSSFISLTRLYGNLNQKDKLEQVN